jgi:glycosyltransferase involved in cell wall biosynthesis
VKKVLFIVKNSNEASSRFRVFAYLPYIKDAFDTEVFFAEYNSASVPKPLRSIVKRLRFLTLLLRARNYDVLFMQRPMSSDKNRSTFFEKLLSIVNPNIIFDFDDALFTQNEPKIVSLITLSKTIICGNGYLADFARKYNPNTFILPTTTDTAKFRPTAHDTDRITIGWTGTSGNYANFTDELIAALRKVLALHANVKVLFICDREPPAHFGFPYEFIRWDSNTEVEDLRKIDIGLMPLIDSPWTRGKCGFKLIQYGAIGIASVGSDVGVNADIILEGESGFLIRHESEWFDKIEKLLTDRELREAMGLKARVHIEQHYDTSRNAQMFKKLIEESAARS